MQKSHAELQKYHYEAVRDNLEYRILGQMDVMREQIGLEMPRVPIEETKMDVITPEPTAQVNNIIQLRGQVLYLQNKINAHLDRSKKKIYTIE